MYTIKNFKHNVPNISKNMKDTKIYSKNRNNTNNDKINFRKKNQFFKII